MIFDIKMIKKLKYVLNGFDFVASRRIFAFSMDKHILIKPRTLRNMACICAEGGRFALTFRSPLMCSSCTSAVDASGLKVTWKEPHTVSEDSKHGRAFPKDQEALIAHIRKPDPHQRDPNVPVLISNQTHCVTESLSVTEQKIIILKVGRIKHAV